MPVSVSHIRARPAERISIAFVPPLIPTLVDEPPAGDGWIHEIKHDGYRVQIIVDRGQARGFTRNGLDWTARFGPVIDCAAGLRCTSAVIAANWLSRTSAAYPISMAFAPRSALTRRGWLSLPSTSFTWTGWIFGFGRLRSAAAPFESCWASTRQPG